MGSHPIGEPGLPVAVITAFGSLDTAVSAIRAGAYDFVEKPLDRERILLTVKNAARVRELADENVSLKRKVSDRYRILGGSPALG